MIQIGAQEARARFSQLLEQVAAGHSFTITKHGKPVAMLQPVDSSRSRVGEILEDIRAHRIVWRAGEPDIREMIDDGRL